MAKIAILIGNALTIENPGRMPITFRYAARRGSNKNSPEIDKAKGKLARAIRDWLPLPRSRKKTWFLNEKPRLGPSIH